MQESKKQEIIPNKNYIESWNHKRAKGKYIKKKHKQEMCL